MSLVRSSGRRIDPADCADRASPHARWPTALAIAACALALSGCGSSAPRKDPLADVQWDFAADAVMLEIVADPGLNDYDGQAHTLLLGVYETADAQAFRNLTADAPSLASSMASGMAPAAFAQFSRYVVAPGRHAYLILDRAQSTRSIGIVAGYAQMSAGSAVRQFDVPVVTTKTGFIFKHKTMSPGPLVVKLNFGPQGIVNAQPLANRPADADLKRAQAIDGGGREIRLDEAAERADGGPALRRLGSQAGTAIPPMN